MRVAIATAAGVAASGLDVDEPLLLAALAARGAAGQAAVWDDPHVDWSSFDIVVVRSTWDYVHRRDELLDWARRVVAVARLVNPVDVLAWSTDKRYLADLVAAGLPVVATDFLAPGDPVALPVGGRVVVKPAVSAGAVDTARHSLPGGRSEAEAHVARLHAAGRVVLVQPYESAVDDHGETAVVVLGGEVSHAIRKGALLGGGVGVVADLYLEEEITARVASAAERDIALAALAAVPGGSDRLAYARVDLVPGADGQPLILELELAEPSLFLSTAPGAADRLAEVLLKTDPAPRG